MIINIDKRIYPDDCISKAVYSLADKYVIERSYLSETEECIKVIPKSNTADQVVKADLFNHLNDYKLRTIIEKETHDIRTILYAKAFADCDDVSEEDLD